MIKLLYYDLNLPYLLRDADYPVGGATVEWYAWIKGFIANNQRVGVLTWKGAKEYIGNSAEFDIVEAYDMHGGIPKIQWLYKIYPALMSAVKQYKPDYLIQACAGVVTGVLANIGRRQRIPFVYRVENNMDTDHWLNRRLSKSVQYVYKYGLKNSHRIICQNNYQYDNLKSQYSSEKLVVIHAPFCNEDSNNEVKKLSERKYIAWLAVFHHQKNLPALLKIVKELPQLEFRIAGKAGANLDQETKNALIDLEKCENVKFMGYIARNEVTDFLLNASALLNTSHYEGFPSTFLESFSTGTPVVTTRNVDPDHIIEKHNLGFAAKDYSEIPGLLWSLLKDGEYDKISHRCRDYVVENHSPKILARRFIDCL